MFLESKSVKGPQSQMMLYREQTLFPVLSAEELLENPGLKTLQKQIEERLDLSSEIYQEVYAALIFRFAEYVQVFPAIAGGQPGGLLEEGIRRAFYAVDLQLTNTELEQADPLLTYAVFSAALLVDVRKLLANKKVMLSDSQGVFVAEWSVFEGAMVGMSEYYKVRAFNRSVDQLSLYITPLLARQIMPNESFLWLAEDISVFNQWLSATSGDPEGAGTVGHYLNLAKKRLQSEKARGGILIPIRTTEPKETEAGEAFWEWLKQNVPNHEAGIYWVDDNEGVMLEYPKVFQEFIKTQDSFQNLKMVDAQFEKLGIANTEDGKTKQFLVIEKENFQKLMDLKKANALAEAKGDANLKASFFTRLTALKQQEVDKAAQLERQIEIEESYRTQGIWIAQRQWFSQVEKRKQQKQMQLHVLKSFRKSALRFVALKRIKIRLGILRRILSPSKTR